MVDAENWKGGIRGANLLFQMETVEYVRWGDVECPLNWGSRVELAVLLDLVKGHVERFECVVRVVTMTTLG